MDETVHPPRPRSAVSHGVGLAGLAGLAIWTGLAIATGMNGPYAALMNLVACGLPMVLWSVFVDRVHRNASTGLDWQERPRPLSTLAETSLTKLAGLWATWALIAACYGLFRWYWQGSYLFAMQVFGLLALPVFLLSIPYVFWLDRRMIEPRDGAWHLGALLMGKDGVDRDQILAHLRSWAVKGFFLAFMISIVPGGFREIVDADFAAVQRDPVALARWLISVMFVVDVAFASVGYLLTLRPLDAHIRSANPHVSGWVAALICYPPFILMNNGGPLDYHPGSAEWTYWLQGQPVLLAITGLVLVALTAIYAWATVAFGLRFSNLTDRGILTHGPYAWTKHPAYLSKNLFWWISAMPFLVTSGGAIEAVRNTALLALVSLVYYWRAKTEERHLASNPDYAPYAAWMAEHGPITRRLSLRRGTPSHATPASSPQ